MWVLLHSLVVVWVQRSQSAGEDGGWLGQSPPGRILRRPVYPAVHGLRRWRSWNQARRAPGLGVKERPSRVRSHGLEGRVACNGREMLSGTQAKCRKASTGTNVCNGQTWGVCGCVCADCLLLSVSPPAGREKSVGRLYHLSLSCPYAPCI